MDIKNLKECCSLLPTVYPEFLEKFRELRSAKRFNNLNLIEEAKNIAELKRLATEQGKVVACSWL